MLPHCCCWISFVCEHLVCDVGCPPPSSLPQMDFNKHTMAVLLVKSKSNWTVISFTDGYFNHMVIVGH